MRKIIKRRTTRFGRGPEVVHAVPTPTTDTHVIRVMRYDATTLDETAVKTAAECEAFRKAGGVAWFDVDGLDDVGLLLDVGQAFHLDELVLEDATNVGQRPKLEDHGDYLFLALKALYRDESDDHLEDWQISVLFGERVVLTFREHEHDLLEPVRARIRDAAMRIRRMGADYLAYSIVDKVVDDYYAVLEELGDRQQAVEGRILNGDAEILQQIHRVKRDLVVVRKCTWPLRGIVADLRRSESPLITDGVGGYINDLSDHAYEVLEAVETLRDIASGLQDIYLSNVSNRMNEVMKTLTIIATIFIPLTFIAGIYGMNFEDMPELHWAAGYPVVLGIMVIVAGGMLSYFKKKRWL